MTTVEETTTAFSKLIEKQSILPQWLKDGYENGLKGFPIPSAAEIFAFNSIELHTILDNLLQHDIHLTPEEQKDLEDVGGLCDELINVTLRCNYGWGIPCEESIAGISKFLEDKEGLIELGAGSGLWSAILKARTHKNVLACDNNTRNDTPKSKYGVVLNADLTDLMSLYPQYPIMLVWTDTNDMGIKAIENLSVGNHLLLTGPAWVTGNDKFYKTLDEQFKVINNFKSCNFSGGELDTMYVLQKLPEPKLENDGFFMKMRNKNKVVIRRKPSFK